MNPEKRTSTRSSLARGARPRAIAAKVYQLLAAGEAHAALVLLDGYRRLRSGDQLELRELRERLEQNPTPEGLSAIGQRLLDLVPVPWAPKSGTRVFLSYSTKDTLAAHALKKALELDGHSVRIDTQHVRAGADLEEFVVQAIRETDVTVVLVSEHSLRSVWVCLEILITLQDQRLRGGRKFIACYTDEGFLDWRNSAQRSKQILTDLQLLDEQRGGSSQLALGTLDLDAQRVLLKRLVDNSDFIQKRLLACLCLDVRRDAWEQSLAKLGLELSPAQALWRQALEMSLLFGLGGALTATALYFHQLDPKVEEHLREKVFPALQQLVRTADDLTTASDQYLSQAPALDDTGRDADLTQQQRSLGKYTDAYRDARKRLETYYSSPDVKALIDGLARQRPDLHAQLAATKQLASNVRLEGPTAELGAGQLSRPPSELRAVWQRDRVELGERLPPLKQGVEDAEASFVRGEAGPWPGGTWPPCARR